MKRCFIFGALPVDDMPVAPSPDDMVIAADKGYRTATALGITPDIIVGDFDSLGEIPEADNVIKLDVRKDDTDTEHAVSTALAMDCDDFIIYGAVGGKLDHTLGNIAVAERIALSGGRSVFFGDDSTFTVVHNSSYEFDARDSGRISVISLSEISRGVTIKGLSFEADDIDLNRATTLGISNAFIGKPSSISVTDGTLLIVYDTK